MPEEWRPVPGWPCEASYTGEIRTMLRGLPYVLRPHRSRKGYLQVSVGGRTAAVHKLVALAWLEPPERGKTQVRHLDGDKENCAAWNLKHGDGRDQHQDKVAAGTSRVKRGTGLNGSEKKEKEGNKTSAYRASGTRTFRTS